MKLNIKKKNKKQRTKSPFIFSNQDWTRVKSKQSSYFLLFFNSKWLKKKLVSEKNHVEEESIFMVTDEIDILMETPLAWELGNHPGFCN